MIRNSKDDNYVLVEYEDLFKGVKVATELEDIKTKKRINVLFLDTDDEEIIDGVNYKKLKKNSKIVKFLKEKAKVDSYDEINHDVLKEALIRSYYEFNHEMKNKLTSYFRKYVDNEISGIDNEYLKAEIRNDAYLLEYIKRYDNFSDYVLDKKEMNHKLKEKINIKR